MPGSCCVSGVVDGGEAIPPSLELLMSKALQLPGSNAVAASTKTVSANIARAILKQCRVQQQEQQQQLPEQSQDQSQQESTKTAFDVAAQAGTSVTQVQTVFPAPTSAAPTALFSGAGRSQPGVAVLEAITRLEAKVDKLLAGVQALDTRLQALEARAGTPANTLSAASSSSMSV